MTLCTRCVFIPQRLVMLAFMPSSMVACAPAAAVSTPTKTPPTTAKEVPTQTPAPTVTSTPDNPFSAYSDHAVIAGDGRYVAFGSWANNLVSKDTNIYHDIFLHDRQTGATTLVSVPYQDP